MLGEDHSNKLNESNHSFAKDCARYNAIYAEIREPELGGAPIGDAEMRNLKHERRILKDNLYEQLVAD